MPIIIKAGPKSNTNDLIRRFKKATFSANVVQIARDRKYFIKPAKQRAAKKIEFNRLRKRLHNMKRRKNSPQSSIEHLVYRLGTRT